MHGYRFGRFTLDLERQQLLEGDRAISMARKNFEVLHVLVEAAGRIVTREELVCAVWPDAVVEESTLRQNIYTLRMLLREIDGEREYVETVPKAGYRIAVPVARLDLGDAAEAGRGGQTRGKGRWRYWIAGAVVIAIAMSAWAWNRLARRAAGAADGIATAQLIGDGWQILDRREGNFVPARVLFDEALQREPRLASAHTGKAVLFALIGREPQALKEADLAAEIDPSSASSSAVRGFLKMMNHWQWNEAEALLKQAELHGCPDVFCHQWYGLYLALTGRMPQALRELASALEMNPSRLAARAQFGQILYWSGDTEGALREFQTVVESGGSATHARLDQWKAQLAGGDTAAACRTVLLAREPSWYRLPPTDGIIQLRKRTDLIGKPEFFRELLAIEERLRGDAYFMAELAMAAGDRERALKELERALAAHHFFLPFAKRDPLFAPLHDEVRYQAVMQKVGL